VTSPLLNSLGEFAASDAELAPKPGRADRHDTQPYLVLVPCLALNIARPHQTRSPSCFLLLCRIITFINLLQFVFFFCILQLLMITFFFFVPATEPYITLAAAWLLIWSFRVTSFTASTDAIKNKVSPQRDVTLLARRATLPWNYNKTGGGMTSSLALRG